MLVDEAFVFNELILEPAFQLDAPFARLRQAIDRVHHQMEAVELIQDCHVKWGRDCALLLVAANVNVVMVGPPVCETVNQPRIAVEGEDHMLVLGEKCVEDLIAQTVRMLALRLQFHQINDVDDTDF